MKSETETEVKTEDNNRLARLDYEYLNSSSLFTVCLTHYRRKELNTTQQPPSTYPLLQSTVHRYNQPTLWRREILG